MGWSRRPDDFDFFDDADYPMTEDDSLIAGSLHYPGSCSRGYSRKKGVNDMWFKEGDALSQIAVRFGVSITTLLWNNNMVSGDFIKIGLELEILPIDDQIRG